MYRIDMREVIRVNKNYKLKKNKNGVRAMRKRVPKRVLNMAKNPINIRSKTPLVSTLTRGTMAKRRAYRVYTWTLLFLSRWVQN